MNAMALFYQPSSEQLLKDRNNLFKEVGIPALENKGFVPGPFSTSWNGQYNKSIKGYCYEFCRLNNEKLLEWIDIYILSGEKWIQIFLNIFELVPHLTSINELMGTDGSKFGIPPNSMTKMRLRNTDYKGPPLFYMLFLPEYKIGTFFTRSGYESEISKLKRLVKSDMENIDSFIERWHELHTPNLTDWEGNVIK